LASEAQAPWKNLPARRASLSSQPTAPLQISMTRRLARIVPAGNCQLRCEEACVTCSRRDPPGATRCPSINKNLVAATFNTKKGAEIPFISGSHGLLFSKIRTPSPRNSAPQRLGVVFSPRFSPFQLPPANHRGVFTSLLLYVITSLLHSVLTLLPLPGSILPTSSPRIPPGLHQSRAAGRIARSYLPIPESADPCDTPPE